MPVWLWWQRRRFRKNFHEIAKGRKLVDSVAKDCREVTLQRARKIQYDLEQQLQQEISRSSGVTSKQRHLLTKMKLAKSRADGWEQRAGFLEELSTRIQDLNTNAKHVITMQEISYRMRSLGDQMTDPIMAAFQSMETINMGIGTLLRDINKSSTDMVRSTDDEDATDVTTQDNEDELSEETAKDAEDNLNKELQRMHEKIKSRGAAASSASTNGHNGTGGLGAGLVSVPLEDPVAQGESDDPSLSLLGRTKASNGSNRVRDSLRVAVSGLGTPSRSIKPSRARVDFSKPPGAGLSDDEIDLEAELGGPSSRGAIIAEPYS